MKNSFVQRASRLCPRKGVPLSQSPKQPPHPQGVVRLREAQQGLALSPEKPPSPPHCPHATTDGQVSLERTTGNTPLY